MARITVEVALITMIAALPLGCTGSAPPDEPKSRGIRVEDAENQFPLAESDYFVGMDGVVNDAGEFVVRELTANQIKGRNAWMMWTGGNEAFWDWFARNGYGTIDLLKLLDSNHRGSRFQRAGLITEPKTRPPTAEETASAYGIRYDRPVAEDPDRVASNGSYYGRPNPKVYGYSSGIVGLRLFPNPEFDATAALRWNAERYYSDPRYASDPSTIRPFRVGMSCAFCHAAPHPLNPPADPEAPEWENLSASIGNQYLRAREVFGNVLEKDSFLYHVIDSQPPGTIDTSLIASDNINNPNTMNAVFGLGWRVRRSLHNSPEVLARESAAFPGLWKKYPHGEPDPHLEGNPRAVPRVLVDGSDSVGTWVALARVYLNIGSYHQQWIRLHNPIFGFRHQRSFKLADLETNSVYWHATKLRIDPMTAFFVEVSGPMRLKDAPGGSEAGSLKGQGVPWDDAYAQGREVFARGCIACHSSIQPGDFEELEKQISGPGIPADVGARAALRLRDEDLARLARGDGSLPAGYVAWATAAVELPAFWQENYLSTDLRIPVTLTRTNSARALATNALHGQMWEDFSSLTYKELDSVGRITYRDPLSHAQKSFMAPSGGRGYYRVPTLMGAWATAPYFHNNALGDFTNDPSVVGRLATFDDAIGKLLWPERRFVGHDRMTVATDDNISSDQLKRDGGLVWRSTSDTNIFIYGHQIPSLIAGLTGWSRFWVRLFPWLPTIVFLLIGVGFLFAPRIAAWNDRLAGRLSGLRHILIQFRWVVLAVSLSAALLITLLAYWYWEMLKAVELASEWDLPWIRVHAMVAVVFFLFIAAYAASRILVARVLTNRVALWSGLASLVTAVIFALGVGRFLAGRGGDLKFGPLPAGMSVNLLANMDPDAPLKMRLAAVKRVVEFVRDWHDSPAGEKPGLAEFERNVAPQLMAVSKCPDFVMDRGHDYEFIRAMSDEEKQSLIELIKTF